MTEAEITAEVDRLEVVNRGYPLSANTRTELADAFSLYPDVAAITAAVRAFLDEGSLPSVADVHRLRPRVEREYCGKCDGTGWKPTKARQTCRRCRERGRVFDQCPVCRGRGQVEYEAVMYCECRRVANRAGNGFGLARTASAGDSRG